MMFDKANDTAILKVADSYRVGTSRYSFGCYATTQLKQIDTKYLPMDEIIAAVIAALPAAEEVEI
jgi:hypothetical protein